MATKNFVVEIFPQPRGNLVWPGEWVTHGVVRWKGVLLFQLVECPSIASPFFLRADDQPTLKCNWGEADSLEELVDKVPECVGAFERFLLSMHQRPKMKESDK
jgi:hypothetical protein